VCSSAYIIGVIKSRKITWARHVARMIYILIEYKILVGKPKGKRPLGRSCHRWEGDVKMHLKE